MEKLKLTNELELIREWASKKGIYDDGDVKTQTLKLFEEAGELSKAIINKGLFRVHRCYRGLCCCFNFYSRIRESIF